MSRIAMIDPMTLLGRETLSELGERNYHFDDLALYHSSDVEEHQVTAAGGSAMLVSRLQAPEDLEGAEVIILSSDRDTEGLEVLDRVIEERQDLLFIDASGISRYEHLGQAIAGGRALPSSRRLRLADPALVMAMHLLEAFDGFGLRSLSLASVQPVSAMGEGGIEILARQAARRLQGENLDENEEILAFNIKTVDPGRMKLDSRELFPGVEVTISVVMGGCFHGHLLHFGLGLEERVDIGEVETALRSSDRLRRVEFPMNLSQVPDREQILVGEPSLSEDGKNLLIQAMADGSRIGGAMILADLIESGSL